MKLMIKCLVLFLVCFLSVFAQRKRTHHQQEGQNPKLYLCMGDLGPTVQPFMKANNIQYVKLIGAASIDPHDDMTVNEDVLKKEITRLFPNSTDAGTAILDWEGKAMNTLNTISPDDPNYTVQLNKFIRAMQVSKQLRPNVKWSFYGLPLRGYWTLDNAWQKRNLGLAPLLRICDFIAPSLYNPYPDSVSRNQEQVYVRANIQIALKLGSMVNRPVYVLVWHRLPNERLIAKDEFLGHVKKILAENYNGNKVKAIIWYGEDTYEYNVKNKQMVSEVQTKENLTPYLTQMITDYGSGILKLIDQQK
jgi:hypothetical protein